MHRKLCSAINGDGGQPADASVGDLGRWKCRVVQRPVIFPFSLKTTTPVSRLAQMSCFLLNLRAAPRSSMRVAGTGPFVRMSIRKVLAPAALPRCWLITTLVCGGRSLSNLSNRLTITATFWFVCQCSSRAFQKRFVLPAANDSWQRGAIGKPTSGYSPNGDRRGLACVGRAVALCVARRNGVLVQCWNSRPDTAIAALIILCSSTPTLSNNIIPKGLAFVCQWSGSVLAPGAEALRGPAPPA